MFMCIYFLCSYVPMDLCIYAIVFLFATKYISFKSTYIYRVCNVFTHIFVFSNMHEGTYICM